MTFDWRWVRGRRERSHSVSPSAKMRSEPKMTRLTHETAPSDGAQQRPGPGFHKLLSLEVTGGFLKGAELEFADGLNCIIGGRGTGKTTVLEFVRYVLGLVPDQRENATLARGIEKLVQGNLRSGRIRLRVETKHGMRYLAERPWNDSSQVFDENDEATAISLDRDLIFKADVYSQNEIEEIATNPRYQLALIDNFIDEDIRRITGTMQKVAGQLDQNSRELRALRAKASELSDSASETAALEEKLKALQAHEGPEADVINLAHEYKALRSKEQKALELLRADVRRAGAELDATITSAATRMAARVDGDLADGPNKELFGRVSQAVRAFTLVLEDTSSRVSDACRTADTALATEVEKLEELHAQQEAAYRGIVAESEEEQGRATERLRLQQRYIEVTSARQELGAVHTELRAAEERRQALTSELSALRDERFACRKSVADRLTSELGPVVRVSVTQAGDRDAYRALLTEALKGRRMKYATLVERIAQNLPPEELAELVDRQLMERLADRAGIPEDRARRVIDALGEDARYGLDTVDLEDLPRIELLDGDEYKDSGNLSTGQRCTTILPILLLESERPLLIDQPEDNLDNAFIYDTVVRRLITSKETRQLIFVTHNPNIPVLGDADRVFVLCSDGKQGTVQASGTVEAVKTHIETLLEGGREAFLLRKERYGY